MFAGHCGGITMFLELKKEDGRSNADEELFWAQEGKRFGEVCLWTLLKIIIMKTLAHRRAEGGQEGKRFHCCWFSAGSADVSHWWHMQSVHSSDPLGFVSEPKKKKQLFESCSCPVLCSTTYEVLWELENLRSLHKKQLKEELLGQGFSCEHGCNLRTSRSLSSACWDQIQRLS